MLQVLEVCECSVYPRREVNAHNLPIAIRPIED